jgi:Putative adhesin
MKDVRARLILVLCLITGFAQASEAAAEGHFDRSLSVSSLVKLDVWTDSGDISVRSGEPGKIEIHARLHGTDSNDESIESRIQAIESNPPILRASDGHSLRIGHFDNEDISRGISITYEIVVPADAQLRSETGSGDQTVEGIRGSVDATSGSGNLHLWHIAKDIHADTGSGDIDLRDIHGKVHAKAGTGTIRAAEIVRDRPASPHATFSMLSPPTSQQSMTVRVVTDLDDVEMEVITGSGDVEVEGLEGGLQVTTGSGNIRVSGKPASGWTLDTGAGTVRVLFALGANLALEAHTSSGMIRTQDSVTVHGKSTPHELRGQVGEGGPSVYIKTASGDIAIE